MKLLAKTALILPLLLVSALASATEGKVVKYKAACGYLLVESTEGYLLLKNQGSGTYLKPKKGDLITGAFLENYGIGHLTKVSSTEVMWVFNDSGWLSKELAAKQYKQKCGS